MMPGGLNLRRGSVTLARAAGVVLILGVTAFAWVTAYRAEGGETFDLIYGLLGPIAYLVPGLVLLLRRDWHVVGWLLAWFGMGTAFTFSGAWGTYPIGDGWVLLLQSAFEGSLFWYPMVALLLVFPDGFRDQTHRQRQMAHAMLTIALVPVVLEILAANVGPEDGPHRPNPLGIGFVPASITEATFVLTFIVLATAFAALVVRYRSAAREARRQYRWVLSALAVLVVSLVLGIAGSEISNSEDTLWWVPIMFAYILLPASFMVAILRFRLYEIDRIISRTVSYAVVVVVLAAVFAGIAVGVPQLLDLPTNGELLVAAATLAAAALFNPLRKRAQNLIDRRFNRTRYDAQREVDRFAEHLRTELSLDDLTDQALKVVTKALQPTSASVWIREV